MGFVVVFLGLVAVNIIPNSNIYGNFLLGIIAALSAVAIARYFDSDSAGLAGAVCVGMIMVPFFAYLFFYATVGVHGVSAQAAPSNFGDYMVRSLITAIPSTITGGIGAWIVEASAD